MCPAARAPAQASMPGACSRLAECAGLGATATRFDASSFSGDPTLLVATTRKAVNGGRAKPWFGPERASAMTVCASRSWCRRTTAVSLLAAVGLGDWRIDEVEPMSGEVSDLPARRPASGGDVLIVACTASKRRRSRTSSARCRAPLRWNQVPRPDDGILLALEGGTVRLRL